MASEHLAPDTSSQDVLSRVAQIPALSGLPKQLVPVEKLRDVYRRVQRSPDDFRLETLLSQMRVGLRVTAADCARIPTAGPVVVVANHPFGVLDGAILTVLLTRVRHDVKIVTNFVLGDVPELQQHCFFVDPFETDRSMEANRRALKECLTWLHRGGILAIFPAGEVSHLQVPEAKIADPAWNQTAVRLARRTGASVLPIFFCGHNSVGFQILGMFHPRLRTALLLQEFLQQEGKTIEVRVGTTSPASALPQSKTIVRPPPTCAGAPICLRIEARAKAPGPPPCAPGLHSRLSAPSPYLCSHTCCRKNWPSSRRTVA